MKKSEKKRLRATRHYHSSIKQMELSSSVPFAWPAILLALLLTFGIYSRTLLFQYVYDDVEQVVKNLHIQSWLYTPDYFTQSLWSHQSSFQVRYYRPVFLLWLRLNDAMFGLDAHSWHMTTVAIHLVATFFVYALVRSLLPNWQQAFLTALFFGLHPIHIQVVAWVSAVSEALLAGMLVASFLGYVESFRRKNRWWWAGSLACYGAALLLKETAVVYPIIIWMFAWLEYHENEREKRLSFATFQTLPYVALAAIYLMIRWSVLKGIATTMTPLGSKAFVLTLPSVVLMYSKLLLWPQNMGLFYEIRPLQEMGLVSLLIPALTLVIASCLFAGLVWKLRRVRSNEKSGDAEWNLMILASVWMVIFLLPALYLPGLKQGEFVQDRYLYVSSIGFSILLSLGLTSFGRSSRNVAGIPLAQGVSALALAAIMAVGTVLQVGVWEDNLKLFTWATARDPENRMAQHNLAAALVDAKRYPEAIVQLQKLLKSDPNDAVDNNNLAQAYLKMGDRIHAEIFLAKACERHPTAGQVYQLGAIRFNLGWVDIAERTFREAIAMDPRGTGFHSGLGLALERMGKPNLAIEAFQQELNVNPADSVSKQALARLSAGGRS